MRLSENEVRALILITRSEEPVHPSGLQKELGLLKGSISRIITSLQDIGLVERAGSEILLAAGTPSAEAFKRLYYSHRASPLPEILFWPEGGAARPAGPHSEGPGGTG